MCPECAGTTTEVPAGSPAAVVPPHYRPNVAMQRLAVNDIGMPVPELQSGDGGESSAAGTDTRGWQVPFPAVSCP
jgi:hypothetical protein